MSDLKRFRISLRTLVIGLPLLVAAVGMLWRCGQIDTHIERGLYSTSRAFRLFSIVLVYDGTFQQININKACGWYPLGDIDRSSPPTIESHPWTGRDFEVGAICQLLSIYWGRSPDVPAPPMSVGPTVVRIGDEMVPIPPAP